jgi:hypothetical protein
VAFATAIAFGSGGTSSGEPTGPPSSVVMSPNPILLDNPKSSGARTAPASITLSLAAYRADGSRLRPSESNPITIRLVGAPAGVVSPTRASVTSDSFTFEYDGRYFPNPIAVLAEIPDPAGGAVAIGRLPILQRNPIDCSYGTVSYHLPVLCAGVPPDGPRECLPPRSPAQQCSSSEQAIRCGMWVRAAIGRTSATRDDMRGFQIDSGSLGVLVPASEIGPDAIGPGARASQFFSTSGLVYSGNYYLTPITFETREGTVTTKPILVLGIDSAWCQPGHPRCRAPESPELHYMGVRFASAVSSAGQSAFESVLDNPFLQLGGSAGGIEVSPGWIFTGETITLGITDASQFELSPLARSSVFPGQWSAAPGCFAFPDLDPPSPFCGSMLLDVGIAEMVLDLPGSMRPEGSSRVEEGMYRVPERTRMRIVAGSPENEALEYGFTVGSMPFGSPSPSRVIWGPFEQIFVNTGRRALFAGDFLFDQRCGNVGFRTPRTQ